MTMIIATGVWQLEEELRRVGMLVAGRGEEGSRGERKVMKMIFEKPKVFSRPYMNKPGFQNLVSAIFNTESKFSILRLNFSIWKTKFNFDSIE